MSMVPNTSENIDEKLAVIRHILLHGDRARIDQLEKIIQDTELLSEHVNPIIDHKITDIKSDFSNVFGKEVGTEFEKKLLLSEDLLLTVISPMMGKMIKKFINVEIKKLQDKIDQQFKRSFSLKRYYHLVRANVFGIKNSAIFLAELDDFKTSVQDIFIIERHSGLVISSAHADETQGGDGDIFSGMLTAIKAFGEDAFKKADGEKQELEFIEYESHKIFLQSHHNYFFAVVLNGSLNTTEKEKLTNQLMEFADKQKTINLENISEEEREHISNELKKVFFNFIDKLHKK